MIEQAGLFDTRHSLRLKSQSGFPLLLATRTFKQRINFLDDFPPTMLLVLGMNLLLDILPHEIQQRLKAADVIKEQIE